MASFPGGAPVRECAVPPFHLLALETSCDETACAILRWSPEEGVRLLAGEIASQVELHQATGGVVPEVASRQHLRDLAPLVEQTVARAGVPLEKMGAFAATLGPGLAGALMIGAAAAKGLALGFGRPFLGVNHLEGHLLSPFFDAGNGSHGVAAGHRQPGAATPPGGVGQSAIGNSIGLVVSGGHTLLVEIRGFGDYRRLGGTLDDAAGEAFDKVAKLLGLPYPGGPAIDRLAKEGDPKAFDLPRSMLGSGDFAFSFSGLKTAVRYLLPKVDLTRGQTVRDLCASFQRAVVSVLVGKTLAACEVTGVKTIAVSGGVSLNSELRATFAAAAAERGLELRLAAPALCTDNAAMIGFTALHQFLAGRFTPVTEDIHPNFPLAWAA